ncbi:unnamed protein product [Lymnaea stagnalis]|uniref:Calpain-5 n=1 Tax=Lymnaea stagnalis TaxID=6523 RepID=A0AAV2IHW2_LYMST
MATALKSKTTEAQNYGKLRSDCLRKKELFTDPKFPNNGASLYYSRSAPADIIWKRPKDIVEDPKFFVDTKIIGEFSQGELGNCSFVAACVCLVKNKSLWCKVVPDHRSQVFSPSSKYAGIFHFKFWSCGSWVDVVIDDYLPTKDGRLIYTHSNSRNEFWPALLEKAYAKLFGSYEALTSGKARNAMVDLTGGIGEDIKMEDFKTMAEKDRLYRRLLDAKANGALICASIKANNASEREAKLSVGLIRGHAYSLTQVKRIHLKGSRSLWNKKNDKIAMVRLRNPWGRDDWKGAWCDGSPDWDKVNASDLKSMTLKKNYDGKFWMCFDEFCQYFTDVDICHVLNMNFFTLRKPWKERVVTGSWSKSLKRAGGCGNNNTFLENPQFVVEIHKDEQELTISLEQEDRRSRREESHSIGVSVHQIDLHRKFRMHDRMDDVHVTPFNKSRSTFNRVLLKQGSYCLLPSTFDPGYEGKYLLRIYSKDDFTLRELTKDGPSPPRFFRKPKLAATAVTVRKLEDLTIPGAGEDQEVYYLIKCEKKLTRSGCTVKSSNPEWKERVTLYREHPDDDIVIEAWVKHRLKDDLIGRTTLTPSTVQEYSQGEKIWRRELNLTNKSGQEERRGYIWVKVKHTTNFMDV